MRRTVLTALLTGAILLLGSALQAKTSSPSVTGTWDGALKAKFKAAGSGAKVKWKESASLRFTFQDVGTWQVVDESEVLSGGPVTSGTWVRRGSRIDLAFDADGMANLASAIGTKLTEDSPGTEFGVTILQLKGKAKVTRKRRLGDLFSASLSARFTASGDGLDRRGILKIKGKATHPSGGGNGSGPVLVTQDMFRELTDRMAVSRSYHTSTLLEDGTVLIAGGYSSGTTVNSLAEMFDPETEQFWVIGERMNQARGNHTAARLADGRVILVGGEVAGSSRALNSVEIFDPLEHTFTLAEPMLEERTSHAMTLLPDGRVFVCGGRTSSGGSTVWHRSAEIYDPRTGEWSYTANEMDRLRAGHRATLLRNGLVLITGGSGGDSAEIFDPSTGRFRTIASPMVEAGRSLHSVVEFKTGLVLITNGGTLQGEFFDPLTERFYATGNKDQAVRSAAVTMHFAPNQVLVLGGIDFGLSFIHGSMEQFIYDYLPGGRYFHILPFPDEGVYLQEPRAFAAVTELAEGKFLITGGIGLEYAGPDLNSAILFEAN